MPEPTKIQTGLQGKPYPNEHAARLNDPGKYKRIRRENDKFGDGIHAIWGVRKSDGGVELQAIRFDKSKFTVDEAKKWLKDHKYSPIRFEKAEESAKVDDMIATQESENDVKISATANDNRCDGKSGESKGTSMSTAVLERTLDKNARRLASTEKHYLEAKAETPVAPHGYCEGYAVAWDVIDGQGEVMRRGSFAKSIQERVAAGKVLLMVKHFAHGGDFMDAVGKVTEMREDDYGLWFHADFFKDAKSQDVREKVKDKVVQFTSIGYSPIKWGFIEDKTSGRRLVEHTECKAYEVTLTARPANEMAIITGAKSIDVAKTKTILDALHAVLPNESELAPETRAKTLESLFGSADEAKALGKSVEDLLAKLRALTGAEVPGSQSTEPKDGGADPKSVAAAQAASTPDGKVASPDGKAEQHPPLSLQDEVEKRRMALRRVTAKTV